MRSTGTPGSSIELALAAARPWDVIIVGGGNAAMVAALTARRTAKRVLVVERAPRHMRGGNSRHTRNIRCAHDTSDEFTPGTYPSEELLSDLKSVGTGPVNLELAKLAIEESKTIPQWMVEHGVRWQPALKGTISLNRTNRFFLGGGTALINVYYRTAETMGIDVLFDTKITDILVDGRLVTGLVAEGASGTFTLTAAAVIIACGGFESNIEWLRRYWGDAVDQYVIRGTPYNDGNLFARLLELGAASAGLERGFHAIAVDARSPKYDGGIATRLDCIPFAIAVNRDAVRVSDEGLDIWPKRYASWGAIVAQQPGQRLYCVYDSNLKKLFMPGLYPPYEAGTIGELARLVGLDPARLEATVAEYNRAVPESPAFDRAKKDGRATVGLTPPKSNWAQKIVEPPFYCYPLRCGVTFTYLGLAVNEKAQVTRTAGEPFENLYAAGEVMSGNILSSGYLAGFGLTIGHVFGRIAGREAAAHASA